MKNYSIGLVTGILLTASALMFMGADSEDSEVGRYQISTAATFKGMSYFVYETTLDTKTGEVIKREQYATKFYDKKSKDKE